MPRPDPALSWLLKNDPAAATASHESYLRDIGIISAKRANAIRRTEVVLTAADRHLTHCRGCARKTSMHSTG